MAPVTVVGKEFVVPSPVGLEILRKDGNYYVGDSNGNIIFIVKRHEFSMHNRHQLLDASGKTLMNLSKKVLSMHDRWQAFRGESTDENDLLFTVKCSSAIQFKTKLHVYLGKNIDEDVWDFCLKGNSSADSYVIYAGNTDNVVAQMNKEVTRSVFSINNHYDVNVFPNIDYAFIVALTVILDATEMIYIARNRNANILSNLLGP